MKKVKMGLAAAVVAAATLLPAAPAKASSCTSDIPGGEAVCTAYYVVGHIQCKYLGKWGCIT